MPDNTEPTSTSEPDSISALDEQSNPQPESASTAAILAGTTETAPASTAAILAATAEPAPVAQPEPETRDIPSKSKNHKSLIARVEGFSNDLSAVLEADFKHLEEDVRNEVTRAWDFARRTLRAHGIIA